MKTLDKKSLFAGMIIALVCFSLLSWKSSDGDNSLEFVPFAGGLGIYNKSQNTLYLYRGTVSQSLKTEPHAAFEVEKSGGGLSEVSLK